MPNDDRGKRVVFKNVTRTSTRQTYTLENLPDEYRKLLPPDVLERIRQGAVDIPGLSELRQHDAAFDQAAFLERAATIVAAVRRAERDGGWGHGQTLHVGATLPPLETLGREPPGK